jgi:hypothetical protein
LWALFEYYGPTLALASNQDQEVCMVHLFTSVLTLVLGLAVAQPTAPAPRVKAGLLTCDVSGGIGLIVTSRREVACVFRPEAAGRQEDYGGTITKYGLDLGLTGGGVMMWAVFTDTVAGPGFLAGDYIGASGEATVIAGLGANVLVGGSNRTVALQPVSVSGQIGLNLAVGVAELRLGLPRR